MGDGDPSASFLAGVKCVEEAGYMEAAQHFEKAAAAGHVLAMYNLGVFYDEGLGPYSVNFSKAV
jgi:TPR repeat protein